MFVDRYVLLIKFSVADIIFVDLNYQFSLPFFLRNLNAFLPLLAFPFCFVSTSCMRYLFLQCSTTHLFF